jgi:iron complex outermembrane recepter protein
MQVETQKSVGVCVLDRINLGQRWQLRLGARDDDDRQTLENRAASRTTRQTKTRVSPQLGLVYQAGATLALYATHGENFQPLSADAQTDLRAVLADEARVRAFHAALPAFDAGMPVD